MTQDGAGGVEVAHHSRGGGWREAFLNRRSRHELEGGADGGSAAVADVGELREGRGARFRSTSRQRQTSHTAAAAGDTGGDANGNCFNQQAVLDQDRALIERLTQRPTRDRSLVRKPPPPPKVTPYRARDAGKTVPAAVASSALGVGTAAAPSHSDGPVPVQVEPAAPAAAGGEGGEQPSLSSFQGAGDAAAEATAAAAEVFDEPAWVPIESAKRASPSHESGWGSLPPRQQQETLGVYSPVGLESSGGAFPGVSEADVREDPGPGDVLGAATPLVMADSCRGPAAEAGEVPLQQPVVPCAGGLFTARDIDSFMDQLGGKKKDGLEDGKGSGGDATGAVDGQTTHYTQRFDDISADFFRENGIKTLGDHGKSALDHLSHQGTSSASTNCPGTSAGTSAPPESNRKAVDDFQIPERRFLREQIDAIDAWLEDDIAARENLSGDGSGADVTRYPAMSSKPGFSSFDISTTLAEALDGGPSNEFLQKLEDAKKRKKQGETTSQVALKGIATQAKPALPRLKLDELVRALRLFTSARYEDHDLYLRILGEIPVQVRGICPESLTNLVRILWRLRLHEKTYLELFSMEAMNMIRAKRRGGPRPPPRRPPPPAAAMRAADPGDDGPGGAGGKRLQPTPPAAPRLTPTPPSGQSVPADMPSPFDTVQLIRLGNCLSRLDAKHHSRFMEVFQDQLGLAIPQMTQDECELVCPCFAMSQLMHDPLRRAFLERCAEVKAGMQPFPSPSGPGGGPAPDIEQYHREADHHRRRLKCFRNIFVIEASVRKETFSFFSSLPAEVRSYLDQLHVASGQLAHEGPSPLAQQVANVLEQLGIACDLSRMAGPLSLHVVVKAANPRAENQDMVYECNDARAFYAVPDKKTTPELTADAKQRHRLLGRLGVTLTHINAWEWNQMGDAQRVNYMVKVQSFK